MGVILHWETLFQKDAKGNEMVDLIRNAGMLAGIKLDKGYNKKGMWGTETGPLGHPEVSGKGLDDLQERAAQAYAKGARFAKWRNVLQLRTRFCRWLATLPFARVKVSAQSSSLRWCHR